MEVALEDAGIAHVALRPAHFASNALKQSLDRSSEPWKAHLVWPELQTDNTAPVDIGRVGGALLVNRASTAAKEVLYLCGPQIITQTETWEIFKKRSGQDIEVVP